MIEFKHKLPAMNIEGRKNGTYNNRELGSFLNFIIVECYAVNRVNKHSEI